MIEIDKSKVNGWVDSGESKRVPRHVDIECHTDGCRRSMVNLGLSWQHFINLAYAMTRCANCGFITRFLLVDPPSKDDSLDGCRLLVIPPQMARPRLADGIDEISPAFVRIFRQAMQAEMTGWQELVGIGYRKALEFLVKDFLIWQRPDDAEQIKATYLGACIKTMGDALLIASAQRAAWLGNDETHYVRRWPAHDIDDLKILINLVQNFISMRWQADYYSQSMRP
jgi:hypothetical protein